MCPYCNRIIDFDADGWGWSDTENGTIPYHIECFEMNEDIIDVTYLSRRDIMISELKRLL